MGANLMLSTVAPRSRSPKYNILPGLVVGRQAVHLAKPVISQAEWKCRRFDSLKAAVI